LRFALFGIGNPEGVGLAYLIVSMIVYGMAFDFFNISGSLFVEAETSNKFRSSAQGLFMLLTNGLGALIGGYTSGLIVAYFTNSEGRDWETIWLVFAAYALVLAFVFAVVFKYKHNPEALKKISH
jgi:NHS family xanthosine MFS transporter